MTNTRLYHERPTSKWRGGHRGGGLELPLLPHRTCSRRRDSSGVATSPEMSGALPTLRWLVGGVIGVASYWRREHGMDPPADGVAALILPASSRHD